MKNMIKEKGMSSRFVLACAAATLFACGATITVPYTIAGSPTVWIQYPTECATEDASATNHDQVCAADGAICVSAATQEFPVYFAVFGAPAGSVVEIRLDRHLDTVERKGTLIARTNTSPVMVSLAGRNPDGEHLITAEIVNADGTALTAAQTKGASHKFQAYFLASSRTPAFSGTEDAEHNLVCAEVLPCTSDTQCDEGQVCNQRHRGHLCPNVDTARTCALGTCEAACTADADCEGVPGERCDVATGQCTNCTADSQCPSGTVCQTTHDPEEGALDPGLCEPPCESDDDCYFEGETCNTGTGKCIAP